MEFYTLKEAAEAYGININTLRYRLFMDQKAERDLHGSRKGGKNWIITDEYMKAKKWRKRHE